VSEADYVTVPADDLLPEKITSEEELLQAIGQMETQMREAAKKFEFERAASLRDRIRALQQRELGGFFAAVNLTSAPAETPPAPASAPPAPPVAAPASAAAAPAPAASPSTSAAASAPAKPKAKRA
jgi:hypothetical protein